MSYKQKNTTNFSQNVRSRNEKSRNKERGGQGYRVRRHPPATQHTKREITQYSKRKSVFFGLKDEEYEILNSFANIVDEALKLNAKQKKETLKAIRELFCELTSERANKNIDYLSNPTKLSAYIYYYLWWNLLRFVRLLVGMELNIKEGDIVGDFGSGPLTFVLALWIAKPELRDKNLTFYCVDISEKAMKAGEEIFRVLSHFSLKHGKSEMQEKERVERDSTIKEPKWKIKKVVSPFGKPLKEKLDFFFSANMFNEICWKQMKDLKTQGAKQVKIIDSYLKSSANVLIIEPGLPIGGKIVSVFRKYFLQKNYSLIAPCPHIDSCPLHEREGSTVARGKWCHFSFSTLDAPSHLCELSERVHLAKKTASLSYLHCHKEDATAKMKEDEKENKVCHLNKIDIQRKDIHKKNEIEALVTSNIIKLQDGTFGVYACSTFGFLLLKTQNLARLKKLKSGTYFSIDKKNIGTALDKKSGALIYEAF